VEQGNVTSPLPATVLLPVTTLLPHREMKLCTNCSRMILLTLGLHRFYRFRVPTPTNGSRGRLDDLRINISAAEDGRFPCRVSWTAVSSERRGCETSAGSGGCLSSQSRTAASQIKRARWCCLAQAQFKVEAEAAGKEVDAAATLLIGMLSKRRTDAMAKQLVKLIKLGQRWGHFVDIQLLFSVSEWRKLGETMWEKTITGKEKEEKEIKAVRELWQMVLET